MNSDGPVPQVDPRFRKPILAWGLALLCMCSAVVLAWSHTNDDAYITFRYAWNVAHGRGAVMNVGEHVEGITNFLWMLIVAGWIRLFGGPSAPLFAKCLGSGLSVAAVAMVAWQAWSITRVERRQSEGVRPGSIAPPADRIVFLAAAPLLFAANASVYINATSGLETGLLVCLVGLAMALDLDEIRLGRWRAGILPWALAALTRPEIVVVAPVSRIFMFQARGKRATALDRTIRDALVFGLIVGGTWLWRRLYYGEWLPNTYYAKIGGLGSLTVWQYYWTYLRLATGHVLLPLLLVPLLAVRRTRPWLVYVMGITVLGTAIVFGEGPDGMPACRLFAPYSAGYALLLAWGLEWVWEFACRQVRATRGVLTVALLAAFLTATIRSEMVTSAYLDWIYQRHRGYEQGHRRLATWLGKHAQPGDTVGLMDIGIIGYENPDLTILDTSGLTDRFIAKSPGGFLAKEYPVDYIFKQRRPRFLVVTITKRPQVIKGGIRYDAAAAWTPADREILCAPELRRDYVYRGTFEHSMPGTQYCLLVFERQALPAS
jgi:arabinofuranosyltransferase